MLVPVHTQWNQYVRALYGSKCKVWCSDPDKVNAALCACLRWVYKMTSDTEQPLHDIRHFVQAHVHKWIVNVAVTPANVVDISSRQNRPLLMVVMFLYLLNVRLPTGLSHVPSFLKDTAFVRALREHLTGSPLKLFNNTFDFDPTKQHALMDVVNLNDAWITLTQVANLAKQYADLSSYKRVLETLRITEALTTWDCVWLVLMDLYESHVGFMRGTFVAHPEVKYGNFVLLSTLFKGHHGEQRYRGFADKVLADVVQSKPYRKRGYSLVRYAVPFLLMFVFQCCVDYPNDVRLERRSFTVASTISAVANSVVVTGAQNLVAKLPRVPDFAELDVDLNAVFAKVEENLYDVVPKASYGKAVKPQHNAQPSTKESNAQCKKVVCVAHVSAGPTTRVPVMMSDIGPADHHVKSSVSYTYSLEVYTSYIVISVREVLTLTPYRMFNACFNVNGKRHCSHLMASWA